jgi:hypothetical protein
MLNPMLKAISKMLDAKPEDTIFPRVACAKQVLDELIEHLESKQPPDFTESQLYADNQLVDYISDKELSPEAQEIQKELMND